ncbi:MAG: hypothetical protein A2X82_06440 [Geobacteraceae bacterium GWC2_55_20]|nr:MAG: hypothetical protein A2X82_06440 [Geobacteraceae bacterium GWC2_55_20]OGU19130.1 MAG: hypothetical protein A2X85_13860 [Geobacteraceae bacterium GWF2_54_21]
MSTPHHKTDPAAARLLAVDDETEILHVVKLFMKDAGINVSCAKNAEIAYRLLKEERFDAIITDVRMPDEDGISFLARVHREYPEVPVILMTGHAQLQMALDAIKNGAFDFIQKPFDFELLEKVIGRAIAFSNLQRAEKSRRSELEKTLAARTAELEDTRVKLDFANARMLKAVSAKNESDNRTRAENDSSGTVCKIFSRIV